MADVNIVIKSVDEASAIIKKTAAATDDLSTAIARMIKQEQQMATQKQAEAALARMTEQEKKAALAAYELAEAQNKAARAFLDANQGGGAKGFLTELNAGFNLVTQGAQMALDAVKQVYDFGQQGAVVQQTGESFGFLLDKIDAAPDLLDQLRQASKNTVDDMTLMSSTTTLLAGVQGELATELANATPQLLEIAKAAQKLNPSLGDTSFLYESLATGIKRAQPDILDNLGLTIKIGEANEKYAELLGKSVQQLTAEEQKQALLNAALEQGKILIEQAGGKADSATDSYSKLNTATKNLGDAVMKNLAGPLAQAADALTYIIAFNDRFAEKTRTTSKELQAAGKSWDEYIKALEKEVALSGYSLKVEEDRVRVLQLTTAGTVDATGQYDILTRAQYEQAQASREQAAADQEHQIALDQAATAMDNAERAADAWGQRMQALADAHAMEQLAEQTEIFKAAISGGGFGEKADDFKKKMGELQTKADELKGKIEELEGKTWLTQEQKDQLGKYRGELDQTKVKMGELAVEAEKAMKKMAFDMITKAAETDGLTQNEVASLTTIAEAWGLWDEKTADVVQSINANIGLLDTKRPQLFKSAIEGILNAPDKKTFDFYVNVIETVEKGNPGSGGGGGDPRPACFVGDTLVNVPEGYKAISELRDGDLVCVLTEVGTVEHAVVVSNRSTFRDDLMRVMVGNGDAFIVSPDHPWKTERGWKVTADLKPLDGLVSLHAGLFVVSITPHPGTFQVFDLHIDHSEHTFMVKGVCVHNKEADMRIDGMSSARASGATGVAIYGNIVLPNVTNARDFMTELGSIVQTGHVSGAAYIGG